jgi:predicted ester cyclase
VEIHPNVLPTAAVIGAGVVNRYAESWIDGIPSLYAEGLDAESNKDLCRRFIQKIFNEGELSLIRDFMSPGVVNHELADSVGDSAPPEGHNIEWITDLVYLYRQAFPDLHIEIQDQIAQGDKVVTCLRVQGTQTSALMTIAASGKKIDIAGIRVDRVLAGKIVESWFHLDALGMLRQLDALELKRRPRKVTPVSRETAPEAKPPVTGWEPKPTLLRSERVS